MWPWDLVPAQWRCFEPYFKAMMGPSEEMLSLNIGVAKEG